jgi:hypothetical protein
MGVKTKMTAIADKIRTLLGITGTMGLDSMSSNLQSALTEANTQTGLIAQIESALEGKTGAAVPDVTIGSASTKPSSNATSISFTGLTARPKMFAISPTGNITLGSTRYVTSVMYDGSTTHGTYGYRSSSSSTSYYSGSYFTWTYSNGTLTVTTNSSTNGGNFTSSTTYKLAYVA